MSPVSHEVLDWTRRIPATCTLVGEVGGPSRLAVALLGETLVVHEQAGQVAVALYRPRWHRVLVQGPAARIRHVGALLRGLGY